MKTLQVPVWSIIASILLAVLVFAFTKSWELGSHPFRVRFRVKALADSVATLCSIREDLIERDPHPSSRLSITWRRSVVDLEVMYNDIKDGYDGCRLYCFFKWCYIGMRAGEELARAKELTVQGLNLWNEVFSKACVMCDPPKYPQDPSEDKTNSCKNMVLDFIREGGAMNGLLGIWGLNVKGNSSLLAEVFSTRSEFVGGDRSILVLPVIKAGKGCTVAQLKDAIAESMVPVIPSDQIHDRLRDKSFILLLDDLWDSIDLQAVGIPELEPRNGQVRMHRRKVVFTTSTSGVCARMGCRDNRIIELECSNNEVADFPGMMGSYLKVLDFIKSNIKQGMLRVWGMGGVGKTTLLDLVYCYRPVFDGDASLVVLYLKAGKTCTVAKVQNAIVDARTLNKTSDEKSQSRIIHHHLKDKSFLLLVDDLWGSLDLEAVGIPKIEHSPDIEPQHWRKVVFTTRSSHVCCRTKPHGNTLELRMEHLSEQDAWQLFTREVGEVINHPSSKILVLAKQIVDECGGLPDALKQIGQVMSTRTDPRNWRTTLDDLKRSKLPKIIESRLKLSYDNIEANMTAECFLICSLWTENENIPMEELIRWWIGLGYLDVSEVDRGYSIIHDLLGTSMLEKGDNTGLHSSENSHVKIHRMMRKMSLGTMNQGTCLPHPSHRSALLEEEWYAVEKAWVSEVDTSSNWWGTKYQSSATSSFQLTMLVARHVFSLERITCFRLITFLDLEGTTSAILFTVICELDKLQHLNLSSTTITALPQELENLPNLKYLYIRHNKYLQKIQEGLIEKLKKLRGLDLYCTGAISSNCSSLLDELANYAKDLRMLGFTVQKRVDITKLGELNWVTTLALCMYHFEVESPWNIINLELLSSLENLRELAVMESSDSQNGIQNEIQNDDSEKENDIQNDDSEKDIQNDGSQIDIRSGSQNELVAELVVGGGDQCLFPDLDIFKLGNLRMLKKVTWKNAGSNITVVDIHDCRNLKDVTWVHQLGLLKQLTIARCPIMENLIDFGTEEIMMTIGFPQLKRLCLEELPQLSLISTKTCDVDRLSYVWVDQCGKLKDIDILKSNSQNMIRIDCNQGWWKSLRIRPPYFNPTFHI